MIVEISTYSGKYTIEPEKMTKEEFEKIRHEEETPMFVWITGEAKLLFNSYTCHGGFSGTCYCLSHKRKQWDDFTGSILNIIDM